MNGENILRGLNYTEESFVKEALQNPSKTLHLKNWMMAAACLLLVVVGIAAALRLHHQNVKAGLDPDTVGIDL